MQQYWSIINASLVVRVVSPPQDDRAVVRRGRRQSTVGQNSTPHMKSSWPCSNHFWNMIPDTLSPGTSSVGQEVDCVD